MPTSPSDNPDLTYLGDVGTYNPDVVYHVWRNEANDTIWLQEEGHLGASYQIEYLTKWVNAYVDTSTLAQGLAEMLGIPDTRLEKLPHPNK